MRPRLAAISLSSYCIMVFVDGLESLATRENHYAGIDHIDEQAFGRRDSGDGRAGQFQTAGIDHHRGVEFQREDAGVEHAGVAIRQTAKVQVRVTHQGKPVQGDFAFAAAVAAWLGVDCIFISCSARGLGESWATVSVAAYSCIAICRCS